MSGIYSGGIPNQGFNGTFPSSGGEGPSFKPNAGPSEIGTTAGGPPSEAGKSADGGFVMTDSAYGGPSDMEPGAMKVVDLDDIKSTVQSLDLIAQRFWDVSQYKIQGHTPIHEKRGESTE